MDIEKAVDTIVDRLSICLRKQVIYVLERTIQ